MSLQSYTDKYNLNEDIQNNILDFLIGTYDDWKNNYNIVLNGILDPQKFEFLKNRINIMDYFSEKNILDLTEQVLKLTTSSL